ncbi:hypothetical protein ACI77J_09480 [Pseudomonas sp. O64]|uniref:hypothetical protein n=1 Tax=unclassified Pseudomonas TaxID=196821 RepID=UPI00387A8666
MANSAGVDGYIHIEGFDQFGREAFDKKKIRAGMRKVGQLVRARARAEVSGSNGSGNYPMNRTGRLVRSISFKVSRAGFLVKIAPSKTTAMKRYYPAYLHYGVRKGARPGNEWRIKPRGNYMSAALQASNSDIQSILRDAFADALGS